MAASLIIKACNLFGVFQRTLSFSMRSPLAVAVSAAALSSSVFAKPLIHRRENGSMVYDFSEVASSAELKWTPCYDDFTCALLEVPLDYDDPSIGTTNVAFLKWSTKSTNSSAQDILINSGGPGGSGVRLMKTSLFLLQKVFGYSNNIVGFDPRGVNNSGPDLACFPGQSNSGQLFDPEFMTPVDVNSSTSIAETFARAGAFGDWCSRIHSGANATAKYANTVATAQDMLHYTELAAEARGESREEAKLWYYGPSYGTVLGSTAAAMYPDRIGRMILDGVVDAEDYYHGKWSTNLIDADAAIESFFKYCYEGGEEACEFWDSSPEAIKERFEAVLADLAAKPIPVSDPSAVRRPSIVTINDLKALLLQAPYSPTITFPLLARLLKQLEARNGALLAVLTAASTSSPDACDAPPIDTFELEPRQFIACTDADGRYNLSTISKFTTHIEQQVSLSKYLGETWAAGTSVNCRSLDIRAPDSQVFDGAPAAANTSAPILFIGITLDPVTPIRWAHKAAERFGGSRVLTLDSVGHTILAVPSECTYGYARDYMEDGRLPPEGTVCEADEWPFKEAWGVTDEGVVGKMLEKRAVIGW